MPDEGARVVVLVKHINDTSKDAENQTCLFAMTLKVSLKRGSCNRVGFMPTGIQTPISSSNLVERLAFGTTGAQKDRQVVPASGGACCVSEACAEERVVLRGCRCVVERIDRGKGAS